MHDPRGSATTPWRVYLKHILLTYALIAPAAGYQAIYVYNQVHPEFFFMPLLVGLVIGSLLGRAELLKQRLREKSEQFRAIADLAQEFTYYRRIDGSYEYVSPSCEQMLGYPPEAFYKEPNLMDRLVHEQDRELWSCHIHSINEGGEPESFDLRLLAADGREVWVNHVCAPVFDEQGQQSGVRSTNLDVTQRHEDARRIEHMAYYDPLTDLPNRRLVNLRIQEMITRADAEESSFAVMFLDLNRFKNINDSFGHGFGDRLLLQIAERIRSGCERECTVGRFGGDEFVLLFPRLADVDEAAELALRVLERIEQPLDLDWVELFVSGSVGISFYPEDGQNPDELIRSADLAMYKTKSPTAGKVQVYSSHLRHEATRFVTTEHKLYKALEMHEFEVHYQPKVEMASGRIVGLEALVRWRHPEEGLIAPNDFIAVAEETGQILGLGEQVFEQVFEDLSRWQSQGIAVPVAVNVSARQFVDHAFCTRVCGWMESHRFDPSLLEVEVTEQVFLGDISSAGKRLQSLRDNGISLALDDFGTGYSSFNYLRQLPINTLKIDRSFILDLEEGGSSLPILKAIITLCREMNLSTVVEGVETEEQSRILRELGCELAQGFYYHRPLPVTEVEALLESLPGRSPAVSPAAV